MERVLPIDGMFSEEFERGISLGGGSYGQVFKAVDKKDNKTYAVKRIWLKDDKDKESFEKEVKTLLSLDCEAYNYVIMVYDQWIESNDFGYIKMEFCVNDLKSLLEIKANKFRRIKGNKMNLYEYFISFELFREITECLNYLHNLKEPIMHRDLKPANILITDGTEGRFLKLCDFGLSIIHENSGHTHTQNAGTPEFTAPEVIRSRKYNLKADIYSLGVTADKIFETVLEYPKSSISNQYQFEKLWTNSQKVDHIRKEMKSHSLEDRPTCKDLLERLDQIIYPPSLIEELTKDYRMNEENSDQFFSKYYSTRFDKLNNRSIESVHGDFHIIEYYESGEFGSVVNVMNKNDKQLYVLKKITVSDNMRSTFKEEFKKLSELNTDFVVKYLNKWMVSENSPFHYIQMEQCEFDLKYILENKRRIFNRNDKLKQMDLIEFFISFEIFFELSECINYLHSLSPPIIHRDINPEKVLIKEGSDGRHIKLGDFRYLVSHTKNDHNEFVAPELKRSNVNQRVPTEKVDMYSLGVIGKKIFDADLKYSKKIKDNYNKLNEQNNNKPNKLANIYENSQRIRRILKDLRSTSKSQRPSSFELLSILRDTVFAPSHLKDLVKSCPPDSDSNNFYYKYYNNRIENLIKRLKDFVTNNEIKETNVYTLLEIANIEEMEDLRKNCLEIQKVYLSKIYLAK